MQAIEKKYISELLNADDEINSVKPTEAVNIVNLRWGSSDSGATGRWENIPSNAELPNPYLPLTGVNWNLGSVSDDAGQYIVLFNFNDGGLHGIYLYFKPTSTFYKVITGTDLNFSAHNLVWARVINNILYWTDNYNEPRRINLGAAIQFQHGTTPIPASFAFSSLSDTYEYTLIRKPPALTGTISKQKDIAYPNNLIQNYSFQFCYQFIYWDGEASVLSALTTSSKLNTVNDTYNYIKVTINSNQVVPDSVRLVRLIVKYATTDGGKYFVVKQWDKKNAADLAAIAAQNTGTPLSYNFYNDITGEAVDDPTTALPFHYVPLQCQAIELCKNRLFLGNSLYGYDTPGVTSLQATTTPISSNAATLSKTLQRFNIIGFNANHVTCYIQSFYLVHIDELSPAGWYQYTLLSTQNTQTPAVFPNLSAPPASIALTTLAFAGATYNDVLNNLRPTSIAFGVSTWQIQPDTGTQYPVTVTGLTASIPLNVFKSKSSYGVGIVFYDRAMRKCGVMQGGKVTIPPRDYIYSAGVGSIAWSVTNVNAVNEIPAWAYYYAVVCTKNLRTRYYVESYSDKVYYAGKNSDGTYSYSTVNNVFTSDTVAIGIDMTALLQSNLGYVYTPGDSCILIDNTNNTYESPVLGTDKNYLLLAPQSIGAMTNRTFIYEVYTPYKASIQEPYYEMGEILQVTSPGTIQRTYSQTSGTFTPDCFLLTRHLAQTAYIVEAMCPNDKFYQRWDTDHGRINLVTAEGQKRLSNTISFSATYVQGTQTNGLSDFEPLNTQDLPFELGPLQMLFLTSKMQAEGTVMLALCSKKPASVYIGETMVTNQDTTSYFVKSNDVIAQINPLKGNFGGCINPESVVRVSDDNVCWFDAGKGFFVEYSINGLDDISTGKDSTFKFGRVSQALGKKYVSVPQGTMELLGSRPYIFGGVNIYHKEVYWTFPQMDTTVPKGVLTDYVSNTPAYVASVDYPYDPLDYKGKTFVYKKNHDKWMGSFSWTPEGFVNLGSTLYPIKNGKLYQNGAAGYNNFFGVQYKSQIMVVANKDNVVKEFRTLAVEGSQPEWIHLRSEEPFVQSSDIIASDFDVKEGVNYAAVLRDRLTPNLVYPQITGDEMRTKAMLILLQWDSGSLIFFRTLTLGYNLSTGHL